ncbi:methionyl-tRNA synthetase-like protein [Xylaria longipes]|nr:methionyl-tRNA synthetase-like protein [Xylaria longipes]
MGSSTNTPLLPEPGKRNILITSALPYCNNVPHLGNIIGSVLSADCFARFSRARGLNTLYICGSDEYGTASETKALEENTTPAELCSKYHELHQRIYDNFSISFDIYGRTSTEQHTQIVQNIFTKLWENGFIEERSSIQPYCPEHHSFLADRYVVGICSLCGSDQGKGDQCDSCGKLLDPFEQIVKVNDTAGQELKETDQETKGAAQQRAPKGTGYLINPRCKLDGATPEARSTNHLYLRLDSLQEEIDKWVNSSKSQWSGTCVQITETWLKMKLEPRSITRDLKWGVPIPNGLKGLSDEVYANKVFYVWFDACIGYPSITKMYTDRDDPSGTNWEKWWKNPEDVTLYQFMGKDNVPFHSIVFPACQLGTRENWTKVSRFSTTEYLNYERSKFSKSRNIGVFGTAVKDTGVDTDVWRFYLLCRRPETADAEFLWEDFVSVNNNELLKNLGNLCQRVIKFCHTSLITGVVPDINYTDEGFKAKVNEKLQEYLRNMEGLELRNGARTILAIASLGNEFVQELTKKGVPEDTRISGFNLTLNLIHLLASLVCPYMPNIASSILTQLGVPMEEQSFTIPDAWTANTLKPGHKLGTPTPLFTQIPASRAEEWQEAFGGDEMRKLKAEEAAKAAAKKAAKQKKKEEKNAKKAAATSGAPLT